MPEQKYIIDENFALMDFGANVHIYRTRKSDKKRADDALYATADYFFPRIRLAEWDMVLHVPASMTDQVIGKLTAELNNDSCQK